MISYQLTHLLCEYGILRTEQADEAEQLAIELQIPLVTCLVRHHFASSADIFRVCSEYFKLQAADLSNYNAQLMHEGLIDATLIDRHHLLPLSKDENSLCIAVSDPTDHAAIAAIRFHTGLHIHIQLADEVELDRVIHTHCRPNILFSQLKSALARIEMQRQGEARVSETRLDDEPVITFVNQLLCDAVYQQVSDIHIETFAAECRVRFRRDGILYEATALPPAFAARMITRLKVMANLDITEKRLPQDGRFSFHQSAHIDVRVSTCPGLHGENIVLRLLRQHAQQMQLTELGMNEQQLMHLQMALQRPQGLILVTGPTGSGKTATLYSALQHLNQVEKKILTVEDPVEIELPGVTQVNVNSRIGMHFSTALRTFMRQDPDIIMIGEIRDTETAAIAVQAAQTGHLVLSTLHTNSAVEAIRRLLAMHIEPCQLAGALSLIAAQRLIRQRCAHCQLQMHSANRGCDQCRQGYQGRTGIFEIIPISHNVTQLLLSQAEPARIEAAITKERYTTLQESGKAKISAGITTVTELTRVIGTAA